MKTIKSSTPDIKQTTLEAYRAKSNADTTYQIKEKTHGRGLGVFVIKVLPSREIDFYFHYFVEGKAKSKKLGRFGNAQGQLTLAKAKAEFRKMSTIYSSGIDPKIQAQESAQNLVKEKQRQDAIEQKLKMQGSLGQLSEYYLAHLKQHKGQTHYRNVQKSFNKDLALISLDKKASEITKADIIKILHAITERGSFTMANRMRAYLSAMFQFGIYFDDSVEAITKETEFFIQNNPVTTVQKIVKNEKRGDRTLNEDEIFLFWQSLDLSGMSLLRVNVFKLMLLTGSRVGEMAGLRWSEIDHKERTITLPSERTKNKLPHIIPLNELAINLIENAPKLHNIFLFPAQDNIGSLKTDGFSQAVSRLLTTVTIKKFVPRDLRRTFKTLTGKAGISKETRDRLQNHAHQDVSSLHYDMYDYLKEKRAAMDVWNDYLKNIIEGKTVETKEEVSSLERFLK
jgi:integrase